MRLPTAAAEPNWGPLAAVREAPVVGGREALVQASASIEYLLMTVGYVGTGGPSSPPNMYMVAATTADAARYSFASGHVRTARTRHAVHATLPTAAAATAAPHTVAAAAAAAAAGRGGAGPVVHVSAGDAYL
jgi:hypothetical protein